MTVLLHSSKYNIFAYANIMEIAQFCNSIKIIYKRLSLDANLAKAIIIALADIYKNKLAN